ILQSFAACLMNSERHCAKKFSPRPSPLSSRGRIEKLFFGFAVILFRDHPPLVLWKIPSNHCATAGLPSPTYRHIKVVALPFFYLSGERVWFIDLSFWLEQFN